MQLFIISNAESFSSRRLYWLPYTTLYYKVAQKQCALEFMHRNGLGKKATHHGFHGRAVDMAPLFGRGSQQTSLLKRAKTAGLAGYSIPVLEF